MACLTTAWNKGSMPAMQVKPLSWPGQRSTRVRLCAAQDHRFAIHGQRRDELRATRTWGYLVAVVAVQYGGLDSLLHDLNLFV